MRFCVDMRAVNDVFENFRKKTKSLSGKMNGKMEKNFCKSQVYQNDQNHLKRREKIFSRHAIFFALLLPPSPSPPPP